MNIKLYHDDCFNVFSEFEDNSIDLVLCDMPYGTTQCKWDTVIDLEKMWNECLRVSTTRSAIVLFGAEPFSTKLRMSNLSLFKYDWVWIKSIASGFTNAKHKPMNNYEIISVFSRGTTANKSARRMTYNPQGLIEINKVRDGRRTGRDEHKLARKSHNTCHVQTHTNYPKRVIEIASQGKTVHPTQKPGALMEYLIKTYSNEGDTVLDFCMGSGTTGVACKKLNRNFIGIEKDEVYFTIAEERINNEH